MREWRHLVPSVICISTAGVGRVVIRNTIHQSQLGQQEKGHRAPVLSVLVYYRVGRSLSAAAFLVNENRCN
jgi:hypothetical protein